MSSTPLYIATFGLAGVLCRYGVDVLAIRWLPTLPWSTLAINLSGSLIAGLIFGLGSERDPLRLGLLVGFCGGFTTFSAYAVQSVLLAERGAWGQSLLYLFGGPALGF